MSYSIPPYSPVAFLILVVALTYLLCIVPVLPPFRTKPIADLAQEKVPVPLWVPPLLVAMIATILHFFGISYVTMAFHINGILDGSIYSAWFPGTDGLLTSTIASWLRGTIRWMLVIAMIAMCGVFPWLVVSRTIRLGKRKERSKQEVVIDLNREATKIFVFCASAIGYPVTIAAILSIALELIPRWIVIAI